MVYSDYQGLGFRFFSVLLLLLSLWASSYVSMIHAQAKVNPIEKQGNLSPSTAENPIEKQGNLSPSTAENPKQSDAFQLDKAKVLSDGQAGQNKKEAEGRSFGARVLFWIGAVLSMMFVGRFLFQEQMHERKIIRLLTDQIGPYYREFDPINLHRWIDRAAPYLFDAFEKQSMEKLKPFANNAVIEEWEKSFEAQKQKGEGNHSRFIKLLKVHPIGIYAENGQQPPKGVEVVLRAEIHGIYESKSNSQQDNSQQDNSQQPTPQSKQMQWLWTLKHDGFHWKIHEIREIFDDVVGLNKKPSLPPLLDWSKPNEFRKDEYIQS